MKRFFKSAYFSIIGGITIITIINTSDIHAPVIILAAGIWSFIGMLRAIGEYYDKKF